MNIRISKLSLTNFKCFRSKELLFDSDITTIRGRNGAGKTTIADAILFCLFGKNSEGQSDLELFKTREKGKVIPNLDHSVEITLSVLGGSPAEKSVTLRRSIKEVWVKKRGSEESVFKNNTVEYFVNGESFTKADYEKYINSLISESVFKAITNPNYFPSLKWQEQRAFLTQMVGSIEPEYIANTDELKALVDYFDNSNDDLESYLKHLSYQIKEIKKKLEKIPVRLEEQNKALPERLDWNAIQSECSEVSLRCKDLDSKILAIKQGNGSDIRREEIRRQIKEVEDKIWIVKLDIANDYNKQKSERDKSISEASIRFNEALNNQKLMEQTIEADKRMIERCEESIKSFAAELERLRIAWPTRKFEFDSQMSVCPTCGQPLPLEMLEERKNRLRDNFNKELESEKQSLRDKAAKVKQNMGDATKELETTKEKLGADTKSLADIKDSINTIFSEKAKMEKTHVKTADEILAESEKYNELLSNLEQLKASLESVTDSEDNREQLTALEQQRVECSEILSRCQQQLATRQQYDRIITLIDGINEEQKDLVRQLSELEKKEDVARQYQFRQNQILEERINQHFKLVQWRLFKTVNNGGDSFEEPFCECYVNDIPYHAGLNQAARLNAGLDIINALCKFYNVSAPICLDNSESCINIMQTAGQQVRLQVTDTDLQLA